MHSSYEKKCHDLIILIFPNTERMSPTKQKVDLPAVDQVACVRKYNTLGIDVENSQICAGGVYAQDTCDGKIY